MRNRFNLNEEEKNRIKNLHGIQVISEQSQRTLTETDLTNIIKKVIQEQGDTGDTGGKMSAQEFEEMLGNSKRYNKFADDVWGWLKEYKKIFVGILPMLDNNFKLIGKVLAGLHRGKKVGRDFIKNTLMAMGMASMMKK